MTALETQLVEKHFLRRGTGPEFRMEVDWVRTHLAGVGGPLADLGCGNGALLSSLSAGARIGIDRNLAGLAHTRRRFPAMTLSCADAGRLPLADGSLAVITSQHLIEHIPDQSEVLREWHRALQPGGLLLLLTPNVAFRYPYVYDDESHTHLFEQGELRRLLSNTGFEIVDLRSLGLPWFRRHDKTPGGWRLRQLVTQRARWFSEVPLCRWRGQTLCCAARKPSS